MQTVKAVFTKHSTNNSAHSTLALGSAEKSPKNDSSGDAPEDEGKPRRRFRFVIEPVMMLYLASYSVMFPLTSQYVLAVMNERYNVTGGGNNTTQGTCGQVNKSSEQYKLQQEAQAASTLITLIYNLTQGIPAMLVALFLGSYTDRRGRRLALILPTVGIILRCLIFILQQAAQLPLWVTVVGTTLDGLSGTSSILLSTCYAYIADTVSVESRSRHIIIADVVASTLQGGFQLGLGYMITGIGYMWPFVVLVGLHTINLFYIICFVPESRSATPEKAVTPYMIVESFETVIKKRTSPHSRSMLFFCLIAFAVLLFGQQSQNGIENVYLLNSPLCMDSIIIGYWKFARLMLQCMTSVVFTLFILPRLGDAPVVMISGLSVIVYFIVLPFSTQPWMAFTALIPGVAARINLPVTRSMLSKLVSMDEQGGLMAVLYVLDKVMTLVGNAIFKSLYAATLLIYRGTTFMCFAGITLTGVCLIGAFHLKTRKKAAAIEPEKNL